MYVYHAVALVKVNIDELQVDVKNSEPGTTQEEINEMKENLKEELRQESLNDGGDGENTIAQYEFNLIAPDFITAVAESLDHLDETHPTWHELLDVTEILDKNGNGINIVNMDDDTCTCPHCSFDRVHPDNQMIFTCPNTKCKKEIKVADGEWEKTICQSCGVEIYQSNIKMGSDGKYFYDKKAKNGKN